MKNFEKLLKGCFIIVEGSEGVGKIINIEFIKYWLVENWIEFIVICELGGMFLVEQLWEFLL